MKIFPIYTALFDFIVPISAASSINALLWKKKKKEIKEKVQSQQIKGNYVRLPPFCMPTLFSEETCKQQTIHKSNSYAEKCQGL